MFLTLGFHLGHVLMSVPFGVMKKMQRRLEASGDAEFLINCCQVSLDRILRDAEMIGNFLVALPLRDESEDLPLPVGQSARLRTVSFRAVSDSLDQPSS